MVFEQTLARRDVVVEQDEHLSGGAARAFVARGRPTPTARLPDDDEPVRRPEPVAFLIPLARMTLILPASATLPEALTIELVTCPLLMPIETI